MHIAICDDSAQELKRISGILEKYVEARRLPLRFQTFLDAEHMLRSAREERFTHYFLDVMMPSMDGITAAQEIRSFDAHAKLIFLTSFKEFAYQSYRVKAHDYLLKPADADQLFSLLDELQALEDHSEECICIQNGRSVLRVPFARLSHLEVYQKRLYFHMSDGQLLRIAGSMSEYEEELLARPEFIKIHRSYIVNLHQISILSPSGCITFTGKNLPISRLLYNRVRAEYMTHLFGHGEV